MGLEEGVVVSYLVGVEGSEGVGGKGLAWCLAFLNEPRPDPRDPRVYGFAPLAAGSQPHSHYGEEPPRSQKA